MVTSFYCSKAVKSVIAKYVNVSQLLTVILLGNGADH